MGELIVVLAAVASRFLLVAVVFMTDPLVLLDDSAFPASSQIFLIQFNSTPSPRADLQPHPSPLSLRLESTGLPNSS